MALLQKDHVALPFVILVLPVLLNVDSCVRVLLQLLLHRILILIVPPYGRPAIVSLTDSPKFILQARLHIF